MAKQSELLELLETLASEGYWHRLLELRLDVEKHHPRDWAFEFLDVMKENSRIVWDAFANEFATYESARQLAFELTPALFGEIPVVEPATVLNIDPNDRAQRWARVLGFVKAEIGDVLPDGMERGTTGRPKMNAARDKRIIKARKEGVTRGDVAEKEGVSVGTVDQVWNRHQKTYKNGDA